MGMEIQGRRGGGGGRSSSRGGGGRSRSISRIFSRRSSGGGGGMFGRRGGGSSRGGSSFKKRLVKGAALGAGAYVGYKATKALGKFAARGLTGMTGLGDYRRTGTVGDSRMECCVGPTQTVGWTHN